jgi:hypothetical protein
MPWLHPSFASAIGSTTLHKSVERKAREQA